MLGIFASLALLLDSGIHSFRFLKGGFNSTVRQIVQFKITFFEKPVKSKVFNVSVWHLIKLYLCDLEKQYHMQIIKIKRTKIQDKLKNRKAWYIHI